MTCSKSFLKMQTSFAKKAISLDVGTNGGFNWNPRLIIEEIYCWKSVYFLMRISGKMNGIKRRLGEAKGCSERKSLCDFKEIIEEIIQGEETRGHTQSTKPNSTLHH